VQYLLDKQADYNILTRYRYYQFTVLIFHLVFIKSTTNCFCFQNTAPTSVLAALSLQ